MVEIHGTGLINTGRGLSSSHTKSFQSIVYGTDIGKFFHTYSARILSIAGGFEDNVVLDNLSPKILNKALAMATYRHALRPDGLVTMDREGDVNSNYRYFNIDSQSFVCL